MGTRNSTIRHAAFFVVLSWTAATVWAQSPAQPAAQVTPSATVSTPAGTQPGHLTRSKARRRQHSQPLATQQSVAAPSPATGQRQRDQQILAAQQAQSAETARENAAVTARVVRDQRAQQSEPRIQDAPGPGSQPLPGDPAVQPAQTPDPQAIQDAPGPAQTLPKPPPQQ